MNHIIKPSGIDNVISQEVKPDYYLNRVVDEYLNESGIAERS